MRKIIFTLIIMVLSIGAANASNTLSFSENGRDLVYETDLLDKTTFINHGDLLPGVEYTDELIIKNNTSNSCQLYLKATEVNQNTRADNLLNNIMMKVYLNNAIVYDGTARGNEYNGVSLLDSVYIGEYNNGDESKLTVSTKLAESYSDRTSNETSIKWEFYAQCGEVKDAEIINPDTGDSLLESLKDVLIYAIISIIIIAIITYIMVRKKKLS